MDVHIARSMLSHRHAARTAVAEPWGRPATVDGAVRRLPVSSFRTLWQAFRRAWM